ncbi:MAG: hypothetical protein R3F48_07530 [Candidatus Zixiibacteriota bacterium]
MRTHWAIGVVLLVIVSIFIFGCGGDDSGPTSPGGGTTGTVVDTIGGDYSFATGQVVFTFPANAVDSATTVAVSTESSYPTDDGYVSGTCYSFSPDGIVFNSPVSVRIRYTENNVPQNVDESTLGLYKIVGSTWQAVGGYSVNTDSNWVTAPLSGFSSYGILGTVSGGETEYNGDYYIYDSTTLANFQQYTSITGKLEIRSDAPDTVTLPNLRSVTGNLHFYGPAAITHNVARISLPVLETVGSAFIIENCDSLRDIEMPSCGAVGSIGIMKNRILPDVSGISNITVVNPASGPYLGSIQIYNNDSLMNFDGLSSIAGTATSVMLQDNPSLTSIAGIAGISRINNNLELRRCNKLQNLSSLALNYCGGHCIIGENAMLNTLEGLGSLQTVGMNLQIEYNGSLEDLTGLGALTSVRGLFVEHNSILTSLNGLGHISSLANTLSLQYNPYLSDISDLSNLISVTYSVRISYSDSLTSLHGLENLAAIGSNLELRYLTHLTDLDELSLVTSIYGSLIIDNCHRLTSITGLYSVQSNPTTGYVHEYLYITNNAHAGTPSSSLGNATAWEYVAHIGGETKIHNTITIDGN